MELVNQLVVPLCLLFIKQEHRQVITSIRHPLATTKYPLVTIIVRLLWEDAVRVQASPFMISFVAVADRKLINSSYKNLFLIFICDFYITYNFSYTKYFC